MKESVQKQLYAILRSQVLSTNGRHLFVASNYGEIATFGIDKITSSIENITSDQISDPISIFSSPEPVYSLAYHREFLIVGTSNGHVQGYSISSAGTIQKKAWDIQLQITPEACEMAEVNDLWVDSENETVYAGCGDGSIYICSLDDGSMIRKLSGHKDFVHSVHGHDKQVVSASEDGSVKFWDQREKSSIFSLEPYKTAKVNRQNFGNWIGSASINKDWVATGGGPRLALYHLKTRQPFQIFDFPNEIHVTEFIDDNLLCGGEGNVLSQYSLSGETLSEIVTSGPCILSVAWQKLPNSKILTACGASNKIDVTTNFSYKDTTLNFYSKKA